MTRDELEKMKLEVLRTLGVERGLKGAAAMTRAELVDKLATGPRAMMERAREAVVHAVEVVEEKAHELADKITHRDPRTPAAPAAPRAKTERHQPARPRFDIPSSTVHPHAEELDTLSMAQLYRQQGNLERALEIYEKLSGLDPSDAALRGTADQIRGEMGGATAATAPAPTRSPQGPQEPLGMLDLEELPETYGVDECEVIYKDPHTAFLYWEVTEAGLGAARTQLGQSAASAKLVLRLFTTVSGPEGVERDIRDIDLSWNHGRRYLQTPRNGAHLRIAVGLLSAEGYFAPVAHSSLVRVPPAEPGPEGPVEWMEVVPARTRGREREPLVLVRRGAGHTERALPGAAPVDGRAQGVSSPGSWSAGSGSGSGSGSGQGSR